MTLQEKLALSSAMLDKLITASHLPTPPEPPRVVSIKEEPIDCKMEQQEDSDNLSELKPDPLIRLKNEGPPRIPPHAAETPPTDRTPPAAHCNSLKEHAQFAPFKLEAGKTEIKDEEVVHDYTTTARQTPPPEPADLSNKKPENVTCMPEIECFSEEIVNDITSECSNSSDPDRLEVDMSQVRFFLNTKVLFKGSANIRQSIVYNNSNCNTNYSKRHNNWTRFRNKNSETIYES